MENFSCYFLTAKVQITVIEIWTVLTARHKMMYDLTCMGRNSIKRVYLEKKWWLAWKKRMACIKILEVPLYTQVLLYIIFTKKKIYVLLLFEGMEVQIHMPTIKMNWYCIVICRITGKKVWNKWIQSLTSHPIKKYTLEKLCKESHVKLGPSVMMGKINLDCNGGHNLTHDMLEHFIRRSTRPIFSRIIDSI